MKNLKNCPCCNNLLEDSKFKRNFPFKISKNWTSFEGNLKVCNECSHLYTHYSISEEDLSKHYEAKDSPSLGVVSDKDKQELKLIINSMLKNNIFEYTVKNCLEIGPGDGCFLSEMKALGWQTYFLDKSNDVTEKLKIHHQKHLKKNKYGLIILRHVLEHINEPGIFLDSIIKNYVFKGSFLHIEVPCWDFLDTNTDPLIHEHIQQFTSSSLKSLLENKNMQIVNLNIRRNESYSTTSNWRLIVNCIFKDEYKKNKNFNKYLENYYYNRDIKIINIIKDLEDKKFILHGASMQLGDLLINKKNILKDKDVLVCDGNEKRYDEDFYGLKIKNPNTYLAKNTKTILCFSTFHEQIEKDWRALGFTGDFICL